jgi:ribosomal protein S14
MTDQPNNPLAWFKHLGSLSPLGIARRRLRELADEGINKYGE